MPSDYIKVQFILLHYNTKLIILTSKYTFNTFKYIKNQIF